MADRTSQGGDHLEVAVAFVLRGCQQHHAVYGTIIGCVEVQSLAADPDHPGDVASLGQDGVRNGQAAAHAGRKFPFP